jgi:transposase
VGLLQDLGATVYVANPNALNGGDRRVKNDEIDATDLADRLRLGRLPQAWIAPPAIRELGELVGYRAKLVKLRTGLKAQVHAVMAKEGVLATVSDRFGPAGTGQLDALELGAPFARRVASLRQLIARYHREIAQLERDTHQHLTGHRGYHAVQAINGIGRVSAAVLVAEIGDLTRFPTPQRLCSWCGLTPKHHESDRKTRRGRISEQGSRLVGATLIEGISLTTAAPCSTASIRRSPSGAARTRPGSRWRARSSRSSPTACATARSAASRRSRRPPREARTRPGCQLDERHDPPPHPRCGRLTDRPQPGRGRRSHHAREPARIHASAAEPAHPTAPAPPRVRRREHPATHRWVHTTQADTLWLPETRLGGR